jgi:hypothetical protein
VAHVSCCIRPSRVSYPRRAASVGPIAHASRRILPHVRFAAVRARPKVGRRRRSFRSFRWAATRTMAVRGLAPRSHSIRPSRVSCGTVAPNIPCPASGAAVRARPNVSQTPVIRLVSYAHDRSETRLAFILHSTEPSRLRLDEPHRWTRSRIPSRQVLPPSSFAAVRARPNLGRRRRSFRSFRQASDAHYGG